MRLRGRLHSVALTPVFAMAVTLPTLVLPATGGAQTGSVACSMPPEVLRAIDDVYRAAKQSGSSVPLMASGRSGFSDEGSTPVATINGRILAVGVGAIAGLVVFNLAGSGTAAVPMLAYAGGGVNVLESAAAISRVYAVTGAVVGSLAVDYLFRKRSVPSPPPVPGLQ